MNNLEEWAENVLDKEYKYYYINLEGKLSEVSKEEYNKWSLEDYLVFGDYYVYYNDEIRILSPFYISSYSSYLKEIEENG